MTNSTPASPFANSLQTAVAVLLAVVCAPSAQAARIIDGMPTEANEFPEVVSLYYPSANFAGRVELCTGTLIHPKVILTSAHCVPENPAVAVTVNEGTSVRAPARQPRVAFSVRHEEYSYTQDEILQTGYDFGIVVLQDGIEDVTPAQLVSMEAAAVRRALLAQDALEVVGFGGSQKVGTDMTTGTQRRAKTRAVETLDKQFSTEGPVSALSIGDSGGPAFLANAKHARQLVGVASGVPDEKIFLRDGRPSVSLYAGIRPAIVEWISEKSGFPIELSHGQTTVRSNSDLDSQFNSQMRSKSSSGSAPRKRDPLAGFGE